MGAVLTVWCVYGLAAVAATCRVEPLDRGWSLLGWSCMVLGLLRLCSFCSLPNDATEYASGGLILAGTILVCRTGGRQRSLVTSALFVSLVVMSAATVLDYLGALHGWALDTYRFGSSRRASGFLYNPIPAGEDAVMLLGLATGRAITSAGPRRAGSMAAITLAVAAAWLTISRASILAIPIVVVAYLALLAPRIARTEKAAPILTVGCWLSMLLLLRDASVRTVSSVYGESSALVRMRAWAATPATLIEFPFGGVESDGSVLSRFDGHSALSFWGQMSLVGGLPLILILLVIAWRAAKAAASGMRRGDPLVLGPTLSTIGWLFAESFSAPYPDILHTPFVWISCGLIWGYDD